MFYRVTIAILVFVTTSSFVSATTITDSATLAELLDASACPDGFGRVGEFCVRFAAKIIDEPCPDGSIEAGTNCVFRRLPGSLHLGDITLNNFSEDGVTIDPNGGFVSPVDPETVIVTASLIDGKKIQLDFDSFLAGANDGGRFDYLLSFDVYAPQGINGASLTQVGGGPGSAFTNISETITFTGSGVGLYTDDNQVTDSVAIGDNPTLISVRKDIFVQSLPGMSAQISAFSQMYMVPEPSTMGLALVTIIGAMGLVRRRRQFRATLGA